MSPPEADLRQETGGGVKGILPDMRRVPGMSAGATTAAPPALGICP